MISIPATVIPVTIAAFAAYAFSWMKFPGRDWLFLSLVALLAVPLQLSFVPVLSEYVRIGLTPSNWGFVGVWLPVAVDLEAADGATFAGVSTG